MTSLLFIMEKTNTLLNETIHIMPGCAMHLHGHWNKMVAFMKPLYLRILVMVLSFATAPVGQVMTFKAIVFCVE
jgi:RsiW-degrading membrane proteinase PrsW (M82 family)